MEDPLPSLVKLLLAVFSLYEDHKAADMSPHFHQSEQSKYQEKPVFWNLTFQVDLSPLSCYLLSVWLIYSLTYLKHKKQIKRTGKGTRKRYTKY